MYGEGRSGGLIFSDKATYEILFTMDVDVNRPIPLTKVYEIEGVRFFGVSPIQIIADKTAVVSTDKVFLRIKDVVDLSSVFNFDYEDMNRSLVNSKRHLGDFNGFLNRTNDLKHSYEKFRFAGGVNKPLFDKVYHAVKTFLADIIPK